MITIRPFKGYRPKKGLEEKIASKPYDVISEREALEIGEKNPLSFVHIIRSEIDLPNNKNPYSRQVYEKAKSNLLEFMEKGYLIEEEEEVVYIYRQINKGREQNGIVSCNSIDDYGQGKIKKHELTRVDKEEDRINHFYELDGNTEPVFLFYKKNKEIKDLIENWKQNNKPIYDFTSEDKVVQTIWKVDKDEVIRRLQDLFKEVDSLYIADGHHRTESSYKVGLKKRQENPNYSGDEEFNFFMSVAFPEDELYIMPYNRVVADLNGYSREEFLERVQEKFQLDPMEALEEPTRKSEFTMIVDNKYYRLRPREEVYNKGDIVESLDVAILQNNILDPILGIRDPRTDSRIEFFGGEKMKDKIINRLEEGNKLGFLLYPTQIDEIIKVSDQGKIMPPKSTWFEPKLMSGLFIHNF